MITASKTHRGVRFYLINKTLSVTRLNRMQETLTIAKIAKKFKRDRTTVLRWIEKNKFPNAKLEQTPAGTYWTVPEQDINDFKLPKPGPKKHK
jgi:hypothetical protein